MVPHINWLAVVVATISTMVVGTIWYNPKVFGSYWMRVAKVSAGSTKSALVPILITLVVSFISAWVLAGATYLSFEFYGGSFLSNALLTALILWGGFTATRFITHDAFEGRPAGLTILNCVHELVTFMVMALIIGLFGV